jgi:glycerate 2-kinase
VGARRVVAAFDKYRGSATAAELSGAVADAAGAAGWACRQVPLADGGEGSLDVLGGPNRWSDVTGPLGDPVRAGWRMEGRTAFIEMAAASGLALAGGPDGNDPLAADTTGTGELLLAALDAGARRVVVFLGGSATTDGGLGALRALPHRSRLRNVELEVACDVRTPFLEAAAVFGPQKGATDAQVRMLEGRLERIAQLYDEQFGVDVRAVPGAGAAGGLAGGLLALGGRLVSGFELLAERVGLPEALTGSHLVVTGEGRLDEGSFDGKVVGGVLAEAVDAGVPALVVVGDRQAGSGAPDGVELVVLAERFGLERALADPCGLVHQVVAEALAARS